MSNVQQSEEKDREEDGDGGSGIFGDGERAREPAARRFANPRRGALRPDPDVRRLRRWLDRLGGAVLDPCLGSAALGLLSRLPVVQSRRLGWRPRLGADRRPPRTQAAASRQCCDLRPGLVGERLCLLAWSAQRIAFLYRGTARRLYRQSDRGRAAAALYLAGHLRPGRRVPVGAAISHCDLVAGIA